VAGQRRLEEWSGRFEDAKRIFSSIINAKQSEIASIPNTYTGIGLVANIIDPKPGQNIVASDLEFHADVHAWLKRQRCGIEVRYAENVDGKVTPESIGKLVDDKTGAVNISRVTHGIMGSSTISQEWPRSLTGMGLVWSLTQHSLRVRPKSMWTEMMLIS
jgi:selenocysteine lyase/cysteine desulfurase